MGLPFHAFPWTNLEMHGTTINNKIKNKKWKKNNSNIFFYLFPYTLSTCSPPSPATRSPDLFNPLHLFGNGSTLLTSSPSSSNAASSIRTRPQRLLMIDLQWTRSIYNRAATSRTTGNEQTSPPFQSSLRSCLTLFISHSYIINILYQFLSNN